MNRRTVAVLAVLTLMAGALTLSACSSSSSGSSSKPAPAAPTTVVLTASDNGGTTNAAVGGTVVVKLSSNPSTGYTWATDGQLPPMLKQLGEPSYEASGSLPGSGGESTIRYSVVKAGDGELKLKYWRSFESTVPPVATFSVTLKVK